MTLRSTILTFRIHRFEATLIVGATILSVLVSAAVVGWLSSSGYATCLGTQDTSFNALCQGSFGHWVERIARLSINLVPFFPFIAGLLIGTPLIAREIESGTARLAWSLGPSRLRWLLQRALPILALVGLTALIVGLTGEALYRAVRPGVDLDQSFAGFRQRGLLVGVEAVLIASIAAAFGAILGRFVPTFILTLILAGAIGLAVDKVETTLLQGEALVSDNYNWDGGDYYLDSRFRLPDGTLATWEQLVVLRPEVATMGYTDDSGITNAVLYIPGSRYHDIERREVLGLMGLAGLFASVTAIAVMRRRPR
jgi:hypothetical protein